MKKLISSLLILLLIFPGNAFADGFIHIEDPDIHGWRLHDENQQLCAINYDENGYQKMILAVDFKGMEEDQRGVWLFPVPASPDETVIDVVKGFPDLWGVDVENEVDDVISNVFSFVRLSQIYTFPIFLLRSFFSPMMIGGVLEDSKSLGGTLDGVTIYEHIEKYGTTAELVSTTNGPALYRHLGTKGLELPVETKSVIDEYVGGDYSFVLAWFSGEDLPEVEDYGRYYRGGYSETISVSLRFPTDEIYYPLRPTSVYGSKKVPAVIYVMDYVTPDLYPAIETDTQVTYFIQKNYRPPEKLRDFFNYERNIENLKYTKIKIDPPSKYLTDDLWIEFEVPEKIQMSVAIIENPVSLGITVLLGSSILASMIAGMVIFSKYKPSIMKFGLFGLFNSLTLIGFALAAHILKIDEIFTKKGKKSRGKIKFENILKRTLIISLIIFGVMGWFGSYLLSSFLYFPFRGLMALVITFGVIYLFVLPFVWGYYKNSLLVGFVVCFSIVFIIITIVAQNILQSLV